MQNKATRFLLWFSIAFFVIVTIGFVASRQWRLNWQLASAIGNGEAQTVAALVEQGADPNVGMGDRRMALSGQGLPALEYAAMRSDIPVALELIRHGAKVDLSANAGAYPLDLAVKKRNEVLLEALLQAETKRTGGTLHPEILQKALADAVAADSQSIIKLLVKKGANLNSQPGGGLYRDYSSFLILAVEKNLACLPLLLKLGANPNFKDAQGKTAIDYARRLKWPHKRQEALKALTPLLKK